jgi:RNA polymerase sigma factor (sigma-70 family)
MTEDAQLLLDYARNGSESAFRQVVERYLGAVYFAALGRVEQQGQLAEDVAQEVFCTLARKAATLAGHPSLSGWLYTTTRYVAADVVRAERRRKHREMEAQQMNETDRSPGDAESWERVRPVLQEILDDLKPKDREAVLLRFFQKQGFSEIAATLQTTEAAAQKRVNRALDRLRVLLAKRGVVSTGMALSALLTEQTFAAPAGLAARATAAAAGQWAAAGAVGTAIHLTTFMSATKAALAVGVAVLIAASGVGVYHWISTVKTERQLAAAADDTARLTESLHSLQSRPGPDSTEPARSPAVATIAPAPALLDRAAVYRANPDLAKRALRLKFASMFAELFVRLHLTPAQIEQIETLVVEARYRREFSTPPLTTAERHAVEDQMMADATRLFGAQIVQAFDDFDAEHNYREIVQRVAAQVYTTDTPLTLEQGEAMRRLLITHAEPSERPGGHPGPASTIDWETVLSEAKNQFAPAQVAALRRFAVSADFNRQFRELLAAQNR